MSSRTCVLLGATGLVGGHLLRLLLEAPEYRSVVVLTRRPLGLGHAKLSEIMTDFDHPEGYRAQLAVDDLFCCLGTTIKAAGSQAAFRRVDFDIPLLLAREAVSAGARQYLIVSAVGADAHSRIFYNRTKGEIEEALRALPFPDGVKIVRPSLLLGERGGAARPGERVGAVLMGAVAPLLLGGLKRYRPIEAAQVAQALLHAALRAPAGTQVYEGQALTTLAR